MDPFAQHSHSQTMEWLWTELWVCLAGPGGRTEDVIVAKYTAIHVYSQAFGGPDQHDLDSS